MWFTDERGNKVNTENNKPGISSSQLHDKGSDVITENTTHQKSKDPIDKADEEVDLNKIEITHIGWTDGESYLGKGIFEIDANGNIVFPNGFGSALKSLGGRELSPKEVAKIADKDKGFEFDYEKSKDDYQSSLTKDEVEADEYAREKLNENTYNFSPALDVTLQFGFWKDAIGRSFMAYQEHRGGDVRGNYGDPVVYDITGVDLGATGEPQGDMTLILNPELTVYFKLEGEEYEMKKDGGMHGIYDVTDSTGMYHSVLDSRLKSGNQMDDKIEKYISEHFDPQY